MGCSDNRLPTRPATLGQLGKEDNAMTPFDKCPNCGNPLETRLVEKLLRGGGHTASMRASADVCLRCGERLYSEGVVRSFEEIRNKLKKRDFSDLRNLGQSFTVSENWHNKSIHPAD